MPAITNKSIAYLYMRHNPKGFKSSWEEECGSSDVGSLNPGVVDEYVGCGGWSHVGQAGQQKVGHQVEQAG